MAGSAGSPRSSIIRPGDPGYDPRSNVSGVLNGVGSSSVFPTLPASSAMLPAAGSPQVQGQVESMNAPAPAGFFPNMSASAVGDAAFSQRQATPTSGKGGTSTATPAVAGAQPTTPAPQYAPVAPQQQGFNVNQASAGALQGALGSTQRAMQGPLNIGAYANPYTSAVIDRTQQDIERQRQMAMNTLGAQATAANAFGGSRQGVAEGVMAGEYGRMAGDIAAQQRQANYSQALQAAMADRQARLGAASQLGGLGQQAFQTGQTIQQQQQQAGLLQQSIQQALIDAAKQQYAGYTGAPQQALQAPLAALGVTPTPQSTTNSMQPGLFNYLQLGAQVASSPKFCWVAREVYGGDDPKWLQFREWVIGYSPDWFYKAYGKYGERVAKVVSKVPALKSIIRPYMDAKRKALGYK